jgi:CubicO group peptidase (beta-lactamase class C family)
MRYYLIALPLLIALAVATPQVDVRRLDELAKQELKSTHTPGAAIALVNGNDVVLLEAFGVESVETNIPLTPDTVFYSGGLSRLFTAATLLSFANDGRVDLDQPIGRYIEHLSPGLGRLTGQQLLTSTSGLREEHQAHALIDDTALGDLARSYGDDRFFTQPGEVYSGSHVNWVLAGRLIESVAGKPFADAARDRVFAPLGMMRATYRPLIAMTFPLAQGHDVAADGSVKVHRPFAGGSVGLPRNSFYSARDASRFLLALVNGGAIDGRQALAASVVRKLTSAYVPSPAADDEEEGYGVHLSRYAGTRLMSVNTEWAGLATSVRIAPDRRVAAIVFTNRDDYVLLRGTLEAALNSLLPPGSSAAARTIAAEVTAADATKYVGTFENERVLRLFVKDGRLFVRDESPPGELGNDTHGGEWPVVRTGPRDFVAIAPGSSDRLQFRAIEDREGRVAYLFYDGRALLRR